jgi:hypothetical protein
VCATFSAASVKRQFIHMIFIYFIYKFLFILFLYSCARNFQRRQREKATRRHSFYQNVRMPASAKRQLEGILMPSEGT